jgi:hypothetical protein
MMRKTDGSEDSLRSIDCEAYRQNYDLNQTPAEAVLEQLTSG